MIAPKCNRCGDELEAAGGLLVSPPFAPQDVTDRAEWVKKYHLCALCFTDVLVFVAARAASPTTEAG